MKKMSFDDIFNDVTRLGTKIPKDRYLSDGAFPVIDQGQEFIAGYVNSEIGIFNSVPVVVFGDHTRILKYVDFPFFLGADGVKVLTVNELNCLPKYAYYALKSARIPDTGYNRHFKWLKEMEFTVVPRKEQEKIVKTLDSICHLISLKKKHLNKIDQLASSRFIEMFGDIVCNERIWPIYKFSNITSSRLGKMLDKKHQTGKNSFPYLANFNVRWFHFDLSELNKMDFDEQDQQEFSLEPGDLLVCEGGEVGRCAVWRGEKSQCFFQKALHRVRCDKALVHPIYLAWWFKNSADKNAFENISGAKATIAHLPGIKLKQLNVPLPPIELQNEFAAFVEQLDKSKVTIRKSIEKLETTYRALLQEYFG